MEDPMFWPAETFGLEKGAMSFYDFGCYQGRLR